MNFNTTQEFLSVASRPMRLARSEIYASKRYQAEHQHSSDDTDQSKNKRPVWRSNARTQRQVKSTKALSNGNKAVKSTKALSYGKNSGREQRKQTLTLAKLEAKWQPCVDCDLLIKHSAANDMQCQHTQPPGNTGGAALHRQVNKALQLVNEIKLAQDVATVLRVREKVLHEAVDTLQYALVRQVAACEAVIAERQNSLREIQQLRQKLEAIEEDQPDDDDALHFKVSALEKQVAQVATELSSMHSENFFSPIDELASHALGSASTMGPKAAASKGKRRSNTTMKQQSKHRPRAQTPNAVLVHILNHLEQQKTSVVAAFRQFDKDGSGELEPSEFGQVMKTLGLSLSPHQIDLVIAAIDENGDGAISTGEFMKKMRMAKKKKRAAERTKNSHTQQYDIVSAPDNSAVPPAHTFRDVQRIQGERRYGLARRAMQDLLVKAAEHKAADMASQAQLLASRSKRQQKHDAAICKCAGCIKKRDSLWYEVISDDGVPYYANKETGQTQWHDPRSTANKDKKAPSGVPTWISSKAGKSVPVDELLQLNWSQI
eukprot:SAG31_NODE_884_length_11256_cov_2.889666_11_plen_546_part_00